MGILKFAQFATIEAKVAPARITRTAMLRDARRHQFDYTPKPGFLYVRSRAISSRTNDNFDTYPADELRTSYRTFVGKPVFVNHNNEDPSRGRGIILDAVLHEHTAPDGSPDTWVEVLMEVDAVRFPRLAEAILNGDIDRTSMGCNVMSSECSYCGKVAVTPDQYCEHISNQKGRRLRRRAATGGVESVLVHEVCRGLSFFENSLLVDEPADPTAFFTGIDDSALHMGKVAVDRGGRPPCTIEGEHCENCGSTDLQALRSGSQGYSACCNELVVPGPQWCRNHHGSIASTAKVAAFKLASKTYVVLQGGGTADFFDMHIQGCADTNKPKYQLADQFPIEADNADAAADEFMDPQLVDQGYSLSDIKIYPCARSGIPVEGRPVDPNACPGSGQAISNPTRRLYLNCPVCGKNLGTGRGVWPKHKPYVRKGVKVAKTALGSEWDYGPTEPGPNAGVRWEGVATEGQGYRVIVLWREYADSMAAMLSGTFKDPERAEEWAQKCRDLGAVLVEIRPPMARYDPVVAAKTAMPDEYGMTPEEIDSMWNANYWRGQADAARAAEEGRKRLYAWKGQEVTVVKGRKIPRGTTGIVFYSGEGQWGWRIGFKTADGQELWTSLQNVELTSELSSTGSKRADYDEVHRAHPIETLRNQTCPVCKTQNSWDGNICTVCGYVLPPKPFRAPDTDVTGRVDPDEGWFDPDAKKAEPFDPVPDRDTAMKGQKDQGVLTMAQSIAAAARQRLQAQQALAQQRRAGMPRRAAEDGGGTITDDVVPGAAAPSETTEGAVALPDAQNVPVETPGGTGVEDTAPDATADVTTVGGDVPAPAPMDVVDVEAPVSGATDVDPAAAGDERPNVDNSAESADGAPLNASDWNTASRRAARSEMENIRTAVRDRIFSALRLSKLRIAVGVAEHGDELALAREIENSRLSNESIANEIKALGLVYSRQRQAQSMPTAPHRRSARRSPSMAGGSTPLQSLGSGGQDDEALFEP